MHCIKKVTDDLLMIGGNDRRIALFENVYPVPDFLCNYSGGIKRAAGT